MTMSTDNQLSLCIEALRAIRDEDLDVAQTRAQKRHLAGATLQTVFRQRREEAADETPD